jgi:hypothetical protein
MEQQQMAKTTKGFQDVMPKQAQRQAYGIHRKLRHPAGRPASASLMAASISANLASKLALVLISCLRSSERA